MPSFNQGIFIHPFFIVAGLAAIALFKPAYSQEIFPEPVISIIIDDIGYRLHEDIDAIGLPGPIAYAIMPHSPHADKMSFMANQNGKDILLHLPMQAIEQQKNRFLGPGALTLGMTKSEFIKILDSDLLSLPDAIGVNNHMGSLLTRYPGYMQWMMKAIRTNGMFYIDSMTSNQSVAYKIAKEYSVPYLRRDVFLDNKRTINYIENQFNELINIARRKGEAVAIGHPHPETIKVLAKKLNELDKYNIRLIRLKDMVAWRKKTPAVLNVSLDR